MPAKKPTAVAPKPKPRVSKPKAPASIEVVPGSPEYEVYFQYWQTMGEPPTTFAYPPRGEYVTPVNALSGRPVFIINK